ncbi:MAG TPA: hypothetical protein VL371_03700 [Gemmataceae bacterium]|jgi:hypothetical protein|nr:hypothetical protein [Gemmataceae bacterium]
MSEDFDPLEAELRGFRPRPTSPDLRGHIAERLAETAPAPRSVRQRLALAGALVAAGLAFLLVQNIVGPVKRDGQRPSHGTASIRPSPPTVRAYQLALSRSPADLDALLDEQAVSRAQPAGPTQPLTAFTAGNRTFLSWRGDR